MGLVLRDPPVASLALWRHVGKGMGMDIRVMLLRVPIVEECFSNYSSDNNIENTLQYTLKRLDIIMYRRKTAIT